MRIPVVGRRLGRGSGPDDPGGPSPALRRARLRLTFSYAAGLCVVAALMVGALYLVLADALDVETTTTRTVDEVRDRSAVVQVEEDVSVETVESRLASDSLARLRDASLLALVGLSVGSLAAGYLIAGRVLAPIEEAVAAQRRFVRDASHELRNPLALMRTSLDLALEEPATSDTTWRETGSGLRSTVDRMAAVVDSLLRSAHDEVPDVAGVTLRSVDLRTVLQEVASQAELAARRRCTELVVDVEPIEVPGDHAALLRAVANVVDNALRHAPPGTSVVLRGTRAGGRCEIRVQDVGPGIPADEVDRVFDRGHRSPDSPGLGLGLSIARDIVEGHHGRMSLEGTGPGGTTFLITLPVATSRST